MALATNITDAIYKGWTIRYFYRDDYPKGDRVWYAIYATYITITRMGTKTVSGVTDKGDKRTQLSRRFLQRLSPQELEAQFLSDYGLTQEQLRLALNGRY